MIRRILDKVFGRKPRAAAKGAQILPLATHGIRRAQLDDCALKVCETLAGSAPPPHWSSRKPAASASSA